MGTLTINPGPASIEIYNCPHDATLRFNLHSRLIIFTVENNITYRCSGISYDEIISWAYGRDNIMTIHIMLLFKKYLGFIPFAIKKEGKLYYVPEADFQSEEELVARRKPQLLKKFMGVNMPVVILLRMALIRDIMETVPGMSEIPEEIDISGMEQRKSQYFQQALQALVPTLLEKRNMRLEYLPIYEFLGLDKLDNQKHFFISGSEIIEITSVNLAVAGWIRDYKEVRLFPELYEFASFDSGCDYISDNMVIEYKLCEAKDMWVISKDFKLRPIQKRVMQFLLDRN